MYSTRKIRYVILSNWISIVPLKVFVSLCKLNNEIIGIQPFSFVCASGANLSNPINPVCVIRSKVDGLHLANTTARQVIFF